MHRYTGDTRCGSGGICLHTCGVALAVRDPFLPSFDQLEMRFGYIQKTTLKCITDGSNKRKIACFKE